MIVCYQYWFTPLGVVCDVMGTDSRILFSKRIPGDSTLEKWGIYHEVMVVWRIKNNKH
jgi:hypothetical protein